MRVSGLNKIFFPTYLNGNDQTLLDSATNIRTRNFTTGTERWRDRYQVNATAQYYLDEWLGGRHEFKVGFDHAHAPVENRVVRFDDVELQYSSATGLSQFVTLYGTPFFSKTAVDVTALYAQDSYSIKNLTITGGVRWESLEGYLPEQGSPPSRFFPSLTRSFPEQRDIISWNTIGPRISGAYDLLRQRPDGGQGVSRSLLLRDRIGGRPAGCGESKRELSGTYTWNDTNGDRRFQPGEQTGTPVITRVDTSTVSFDPDYRRPYTDEYTAGLDHELLPAVRLSAVYTYRREKDVQASSNPANPVRHLPDDAPGQRPRRHRRHGGRWNVPVLQSHVDGGEPDVLHQRPELPPDLQGSGDHGDQADVEPLAGARRLHVLASRASKG